MPKVTTSSSHRALLLVAVMLGVSVGTASGAPGGTDNLVPNGTTDIPCQFGDQVCKTDNRDVYFYMDSGGGDALEASDKNKVNEVVDEEYRPTDLVMHYDSTPVFSGSAETDWYYLEGTVSGDADGRTTCNDPGADYDCDQHYIKIEAGHWTHGLVCHESGHAVGLLHGNQADPVKEMQDPVLGCMRKTTTSGMVLGNNQRLEISVNY